MSSSEDNKAAVRGCFHTASSGDLHRFAEFVGDDYVCHPEGVRGPEGLAELVAGYRAGMSNLNVTVEHQFADGDYVATRTTVRGRHDGELLGTAPTGRDIEFAMLTISRCQGGKVQEEWELVDAISLMQQLGAVPATA